MAGQKAVPIRGPRWTMVPPLYQSRVAQRCARNPAVKIALVSPYVLNRHGGVQGQAVGLARSLRRLGHEVVVVGPADPDPALGDAIGDHFVVGHPTGVPTNGSVAPVALSPAASLRAERFIRTVGFDVAHLHEPLAPLIAYGLVLLDRRPRRWWPPTTGPGSAAARPHCARWPRWSAVACRSGWPSPKRPGRPDCRAGGGPFEVLFNGIEVALFESRRRCMIHRAVPAPSSWVATSNARACPSCSMPSPWSRSPRCCG